MNRIKDLREDMDLRQIDVANATGMDQKTLSNYETGKTNPDSFAIIKLADFFGVTADYLIGRTTVNEISTDEIIRKIDKIQQSFPIYPLTSKRLANKQQTGSCESVCCFN